MATRCRLLTVKQPQFFVLTPKDGADVLQRNDVGRLAFINREIVDIEPIGYVAQGGWIFLRSAYGAKLESLAHNPYVAFEVDEIQGPLDWRSVVVHGTIDLNSSPEGALAQNSLGAGCETPCAIEVSTDRPFSVTFKQRGYAPSTVTIQIQRAQPGVADPKFSPNPVFVQLTPSRTQ